MGSEAAAANDRSSATAETADAAVAIDAYDVIGYQAAAGGASGHIHAAVRSMLRGFGPVDLGPGLHLPRFVIVEANGMLQLRINGVVAQEDRDLLSSLMALESNLLGAALGQRDDLFQLHGAALCAPTRPAGLVLAGDSGSGKTTLALALMLRGFVPFTDDVAIADRTTFELQAMRRAFHVSDDTRRLAATVAGGSLGWEDHIVEGSFSPPQWAERPVPIRWVLFVEYKAEHRQPQLIPMSPSEAAAAILGQTLNLSRTARLTLSATARLIEVARVFRFLTGDLEDSVAAVQRLVAEPSPRGV